MLYNPDWPGIPYVDQAGLEFTEVPLPLPLPSAKIKGVCYRARIIILHYSPDAIVPSSCVSSRLAEV